MLRAWPLPDSRRPGDVLIVQVQGNLVTGSGLLHCWVQASMKSFESIMFISNSFLVLLGEKSPWREIPLARNPLGEKSPWREIPLARDSMFGFCFKNPKP